MSLQKQPAHTDRRHHTRPAWQVAGVSNPGRCDCGSREFWPERMGIWATEKDQASRKTEWGKVSEILEPWTQARSATNVENKAKSPVKGEKGTRTSVWFLKSPLPWWWWGPLCQVQLFATPWSVACQAPLAMGLPRQEYWSGLSCSPPGDLPDPEIELPSPALQMDSLLLSHQGSPNKYYLLLKSDRIQLQFFFKMVSNKKSLEIS